MSTRILSMREPGYRKRTRTSLTTALSLPAESRARATSRTQAESELNGKDSWYRYLPVASDSATAGFIEYTASVLEQLRRISARTSGFGTGVPLACLTNPATMLCASAGVQPHASVGQPHANPSKNNALTK
jgi:hypothetical protein